MSTSIAPGTRLGPYEIRSTIGAGGMGEVYRAHDSRLDREVAVKILAAELSGQPDLLERFRTEAKAIAALTHPNVLQVFDIALDGGTPYMVTELLEGEPLRRRLQDGPLPPRKAIAIATAIAKGLGAAHDKGIVHRDLKPENIFLTADSRVKILDFGLARRVALASSSSADSMTPTQRQETAAGTVMGTVGYMSPEQVRGEPADQRSDIFSFGAVLHELVTGRRAFARETAAETMTAILREDPPTLTGTMIPSGLERIIRRCLEKRPEDRIPSARDLAFRLEDLGEASTLVSGPTAPPRSLRPRPAFALALAGALALGLVVGRALPRAQSAETIPRAEPITFSGNDSQPSVSPDGRFVALSSARGGHTRIWLKDLRTGGETPITDGPDDYPRFSPDGSTILFHRYDGGSGSLWRTSLVGGDARRMIGDAFDATWSPDGKRIAYLRTRSNGTTRIDSLMIAALDGSNEHQLTVIEGRLLLNPRWSPDGRRIVVTSGTATNNSGFHLLAVEADGGKVTTLIDDKPPRVLSGSTFLDADRLVLARSSGQLGDVANVAAELIELRLSSGAIRTLYWTRDMFPRVGGTTETEVEFLAPSSIVLSTAEVRQNLRHLDARGVTRALTNGASRDRQPALSPDGQRVIFSSNRAGNLDLWMLTLSSGKLDRITDDAAEDWDPAFTPDGQSILWSSARSGPLEIWMANADGSGPHQVSQDGLDAENPTMTPDGVWIVYSSSNPKKRGVWKIRPDGKDATRLVDAAIYIPDVSPDGRWVAYANVVTEISKAVISVISVADGKDSGSRFEVPIHLQFATSGTIGRTRWSRDGRRLVFVSQQPNGQLVLEEQDFVPGRDTRASRRRLYTPEGDLNAESFGFEPDGKGLILSLARLNRSLVKVEGIPGLTKAGR